MGQFANDKKNGFGIQKWNSGNIFKGIFKDNIKTGLGKMIWKNGLCYAG